MRNIITSAFVLISITGLYAQIGIGIEMPNGSSQLDITSSNKGVLIPRVGLTNDTDISTIQGDGKYPESLLVYNLGDKGLATGYYFWTNKKWDPLISKETLSKYINEVAKLTVNNGLFISENNLELGGALSKATTITTTTTNTLALKDLDVSNVSQDNFVAIDKTTGVLKQVKSTAPTHFYLPPISLDVVPGEVTKTLDLYSVYKTQYDSPITSSIGAPGLVIYDKTDLYYYVLYADKTVFTNIKVNAEGVLSYDVIPTALSKASAFITVVLQVKNLK